MRINPLDVVMLPRPSAARLKTHGISRALWNALLRLAVAGPNGLRISRENDDVRIASRTARRMEKHRFAKITRDVPGAALSTCTATLGARGRLIVASEISRERERAFLAL